MYKLHQRQKQHRTVTLCIYLHKQHINPLLDPRVMLKLNISQPEPDTPQVTEAVMTSQTCMF